METDPRSAPQATAQDLERSGSGAAMEAPGSMRAALANAMVGLKKEFYGRGPTAAKAWILDEGYIFVAMEGGLTRSEETLLEAGQEDLVRRYRLAFQEAMTATTVTAVEEIIGRKVAAYHSQIVFRPTRSFEIFVLEPETG